MTLVSDIYVELIPPNPLELQVMVTGAYERLTWSRGGMELGGNDSVSFTNFRQTLSTSNTSSGEAGEYTAAVSASDSVTFQVQEFSESTSGILSGVYVSPLVAEPKGEASNRDALSFCVGMYVYPQLVQCNSMLVYVYPQPLRNTILCSRMYVHHA